MSQKTKVRKPLSLGLASPTQGGGIVKLVWGSFSNHVTTGRASVSLKLPACALNGIVCRLNFKAPGLSLQSFLEHFGV